MLDTDTRHLTPETYINYQRACCLYGSLLQSVVSKKAEGLNPQNLHIVQ